MQGGRTATSAESGPGLTRSVVAFDPRTETRHWSTTVRVATHRVAPNPPPSTSASNGWLFPASDSAVRPTGLSGEVGDRLGNGVAALLAGDFRWAKRALDSVEDDRGADSTLRLLAQLASTVIDLVTVGCDDPSARLGQIALDAELAGLPWVARLARGLGEAVLVALGSPAWRVTACVDLLGECERAGDDWGAALLRLAAAIATQIADPTTDPFEVARLAAETLAELTGARRHDVALVLGSGWGPAGDLLGETLATVDITDVPGFRGAAVAGHSGTIRSVRIGTTDRRALVFGTRTHVYEGRGVRAVVHGVRTAAAAGCRAVVLTNGCGGLDPAWAPGTPVLMSDHINLTGLSPLEGPTFVDLTDLYSPRLRARAREIDPTLAEGVYAGLPGPHFETPAEIRMFRTWGADLVGMSTALEAIAAREAGAEVMGISLVTNLAAGMTGEPLSHTEVMETGAASAASLGTLLQGIVEKI